MADTTSLTRRHFVGAGALSLVGASVLRAEALGALHLPDVAADAAWQLYVGTYTTGTRSQGIYRLEVDRTTGAFRNVELAIETPDPSYLALSPDRRTLVAVNELLRYEGADSGAVTAFTRDAASGALRAAGTRATRGGAPCYVSLDKAGRFVLVANYVGGNVAVFPLDQEALDQRLGEATAFVQHTGAGPNRARQASAHAHCILLDAANRFALVADLGIDRIRVYRFDATKGTLLPAAVPEVALAPGAGPRHLAFAPGGRTLYVANELDSTLVSFAYDPATGGLRQRQVVSTRAAGATGANFPADLHVHPTGRAVYVSNRGDNTLAVYAVAPGSGALSQAQVVATGGNWPRNFALDPAGRLLLVAHQRSDVITSFTIDAATGRLSRTGAEANVPAPVSLLFAE